MEYRQLMRLPVSQNEVVDPLGIILVKNGSKGDRLLFRYPYKGSASSSSSPNAAKDESPRVVIDTTPPSPPSYPSRPTTLSTTDGGSSRPRFVFRRSAAASRGLLGGTAEPPRSRNPYAIRRDTEDEMNGFGGGEANSLPPGKATISMELSEKDLSNLLAVNTELSERKFELKVKDVRFVGHPTLMQHPSILRPINTQVPQTSTKIFHVAFCLHAMASHSIVKCFYDLSKRLGIALRHEEYRCGYLSKEMKLIISHLDTACQEQEDDDEVPDHNYFQHAAQSILEESSLAKLLKSVYEDVCSSGFVQLRVNNWIQLSFCLPQKIHVIPYRDGTELVEPERIHRCLESIRPYHAILLLVDREELSTSFVVDSSASVARLLQVYSPLKSLQVIAADADLSLSQVVEIASHLVYWAIATLIYPMCETNVYVIAPDVPIVSPLMEESFLNSFPGISLTQTLADFSLPIPLGERVNPVLGGSYLQAQLVQLVCWLLQYRLLIQLHRYLYLLPALHENGIHNSSDGQDLFKSEVRPYEHGEGEDENTVSDSYSETAPEELAIPNDSILGIGGASTSAAVAAIHEANEAKAEEQEKHEGEVSSGGDTVDAGGPPKKGADSREATVEETMRQLSASGKRAVDTVGRDLTLPDIKLFARLSKYFNGEFHFEEIMYRENVRRSQLLLLVDKFRDVLIISEREDPAINFFKVEHW